MATERSDVSLGERRLVGEMTELCQEGAPRRFALCDVDVEADDAEVVGWGIDVGGRAVFCRPDGQYVGSFHSARSAERAFRWFGDLRLVWIDEAAVTPAAESAVALIEAQRGR